VTAANAFKLFSATNYVGAFATLNPAPGPNLAWNTNTLATDGTLRVVSTAPAQISASVSGSLISISWPADHIGWHLQVQTNSITGMNWFDVPSSTGTNQMTFVRDVLVSSAFYRLFYR